MTGNDMQYLRCVLLSIRELALNLDRHTQHIINWLWIKKTLQVKRLILVWVIGVWLPPNCTVRLKPTKLPVVYVSGLLPFGGKSVREYSGSCSLLQSSVEVKKAWSFTFTLLYAFLTWYFEQTENWRQWTQCVVIYNIYQKMHKIRLQNVHKFWNLSSVSALRRHPQGATMLWITILGAIIRNIFFHYYKD